MRKAWCYIKRNSSGCFTSSSGLSTLSDWIEGYVLNKKVVWPDLNEYNVFNVFMSLAGEIWYYRYEATVSFKHPNTFLIK